MAASKVLMFPLKLVLIFLSCISLSTSTSSPSSVAYNQLKFWLNNVETSMPKSLVSKLSPLNARDSQYFASLVSKKYLISNVNFCAAANLACTSTMNVVRPLSNGYNSYVVNKRSPDSKSTADPFSFFRISILKQGNNVHLPSLYDRFPHRSFLPSQIASQISISSEELKNLFPNSFVSPNTKEAIETTLLYCNAPALKGEIKSCPKSLEEMVEFSKTALNQNHINVLTSSSVKGSGKEVTIGKINKINVDKIVSCHEVFLPFATYFCHLLSSTQLYSVELIEPKTKTLVNNLIAVCHMDTSQWPADHPAFEILKTSPGQGEACHWITQIDLVWLAGSHGKA